MDFTCRAIRLPELRGPSLLTKCEILFLVYNPQALRFYSFGGQFESLRDNLVGTSMPWDPCLSYMVGGLC